MKDTKLEMYCCQIALREHSGQFRNDGVTPYINHIENVAFRLRDESSAVISAAWLHDVIEDTETTSDDLIRAEIPCDVVEAVVAITKKNGQDYNDYLRQVAKNEIATKVKIADMLSNLSDSPSKKQVKRYAAGLSYLLRIQGEV